MVECTLVGQGRTAEVLAVESGRVLKLYRAGFPRGVAAEEARVSRLVREAGLAAPAVFNGSACDGLVERDDRVGILYERVEGHSMLHEAAAHPWRMRAYGRQFARLHAEMHSARIPSLQSQRAALRRAIDRAEERFDPRLVERARTALEGLPDGDAVCHGDFHPDNILMGPRGPVIIDWAPTKRGSADADVARTVLLARHGGFPPGAPWRVLAPMVVARRLFSRIYLREYFARTGRSWRDIERWLGVVAVARVAEGIPGESALLARVADRHLPKPLD